MHLMQSQSMLEAGHWIKGSNENGRQIVGDKPGSPRQAHPTIARSLGCVGKAPFPTHIHTTHTGDRWGLCGGMQGCLGKHLS